MKVITRALLVLMVLGVMALPSMSASLAPSAPVNFQEWIKITGTPYNYSGVPDGIMPDILTGGVSPDGRENAYAWSLEIHNGYLYVGTTRNIVGVVLLFQTQNPPDPWPEDIPIPTDLRGRIFRMKLSTGEWEHVYTPPANPTQPGQPISGSELGYRIMKTYKAPYSAPVLYAGGAGFGGVSRLLAIDSAGNPPQEIFRAERSGSIRAMAEYNGQFFWAADYRDHPAIWYSTNPLKDFQQGKEFSRIDVPEEWFPEGAEILDMLSFNGFLYVFFFDHDWEDAGFWCAKLKKVSGEWVWKVIVGEAVDTVNPRYPKGIGRMENGGATPFVYKDKVYVGTISTTMWRFLHTGFVDFDSIPPTGTQLFRFGKDDRWERVVPPRFITRPEFEAALNGFANPLNLYLWRFAEHDGRLYAGTFDARTALELYGVDLSRLGLWNPSGFDLYSTCDGQVWWPETLNGFNDPYNYGARTLFTDPHTGDLYLGTANPFYGCQVWVKKAKKFHFGI